MTKEKFEDMAQNICEHEYGEESDDENKILKRMMKRHIMLIKILNIMMIMLFTLLL